MINNAESCQLMLSNAEQCAEQCRAMPSNAEQCRAMPSNVKHEVAIKSKKFEMADNEHEHEEGESWRFPELLWRLRLRQLKMDVRDPL